jgi:hypothetical protein
VVARGGSGVVLVHRRFPADVSAPATSAHETTQFFFLLVALLLKVDLDGQGSSFFYSGIVGALSIFPFCLPVALKLYAYFFGTLEMRSLVNDNTWE